MLKSSETSRKEWLSEPEEVRIECARCGNKWKPQDGSPKKCPGCGTTKWYEADPYPDMENIEKVSANIKVLKAIKDYVYVSKATHKRMINKIAKLKRISKKSISIKVGGEDLFVYFVDHEVVGFVSKKSGRVFL